MSEFREKRWPHRFVLNLTDLYEKVWEKLPSRYSQHHNVFPCTLIKTCSVLFTELPTFYSANFSLVPKMAQLLQLVMHPKYPKHWPYLLTYTMDGDCSKILNHGLNHGLFLSLFKVFWVERYSKFDWRFRIKI